MVKLNEKALAADRFQLDKQWDELISGLKQGIINKERAVFLMERMNCLERFERAQGIKR